MPVALADRIDVYGERINSDIIPALNAQVTLATLRCTDSLDSPACADFSNIHSALVPLEGSLRVLRNKYLSVDDNGIPSSPCTDELYWNNIAYGNLRSSLKLFADCQATGACRFDDAPAAFELTSEADPDTLITRAESALIALDDALKDRRSKLGN